VIFGTEDILINNIAWFVRQFPFFGIPGDGLYKIRPIYVEDMAELIVAALDRSDNQIVDAVGPETFAFDELVKLIAGKLNRRVRLLHLPPTVAYLATQMTGWFVRDVVLTREEYQGLMANLLAPEGPATGNTRLSEWLEDHGKEIGVRYASEVARHFK
jgi:nucleoside-diphosphate-sugar epimerase